MRFTGLAAAPDLIGRRLTLRWGYALEPGETLGDVPDQILRRKQRDFDFPPLVPADPYLLYDSASFPPAPIPGLLTVIDLPDREWFETGERHVRTTVSVAEIVNGEPNEVMREQRTRIHDAQGRLARLDITLIAAADFPEQTMLYFELDDSSAPTAEEIGRYRATARVGALHGHNRSLWELLPDIYRSRDSAPLPDSARFPGVHETSGSGGQLRRFIDMFGLGFDWLRNSAEAIPSLRDLDHCPPDYLVRLARGIGWLPSEAIDLPRRRNELRDAARLFAVNGTIQSLRTMVTQQTGWRSQVAEMAASVARSNVAPGGSVYARRELVSGGASVWRGALDAADSFDFPAAGASGAGGLPAVLTSALVEPFRLRPGAELTLIVDEKVPVRIRFSRQDFADVNAATAAEVCAVINRLLDDVGADVQAGAIRLTTMSTGPQARLAVASVRQSLLSVNDLPRGAIAPVGHGNGTISLFFRDEQAITHDTPDTTPARSDRFNRIYQKSFGDGLCRDAVMLPSWSASARDLHGCALPGGDTALVWSTATGLKLARGTPGPREPARLAGTARQPFALSAGMTLAVVTAAGTESFVVNAADYASVAAATAVEVAAAMNAQLLNAVAAPHPDGSIGLTSTTTGSNARLAFDLSQSTAARPLGFQARELRATGTWQPALDWQVPASGPPFWNPVADPVIAAHPVAGIIAAWTETDDGAPQIRQAWLSEHLWVATTLGTAERAVPGAVWSITDSADGLPSDNVRMAVSDASGGTWFATDSGLTRRRSDAVLQQFTTVEGLASNDVRAIALLPSGSIACATAAGLTEIAPDGTATTTGASPGAMVSGDLHAIAVTGHGELWVGSSAGIGRRDRSGAWRWWDAGDGLPMLPIRALALAPDQPVAAASAAGVYRLEESGWSCDLLDDSGIPIDARDAVYDHDGTLLVATAAGLAQWRDRAWQRRTTFDGLPANDLTAVAVAPDGALLLGLSAGLALSSGNGWTVLGAADGLPATPVVHIHCGWSAPRILAASVGGDREPELAVTPTGAIWLVWSARVNAAAQARDSWALRVRRFQTASDWGAPADLTTPLAGGSSDGRPRLLAEPLGGFRVAFATDRSGSPDIALMTIDAGGTPTLPQLFPPHSDRASDPVLFVMPGGETWLAHRSDAPLVPAQIALEESAETPTGPSSLVPDAATIKPAAGAITPVLAHAARHGMRRRFADPQCYTVMHPDRFDDADGTPTPFYSKRTLALYMRQSPYGSPVTQEEVGRLLLLLNRFKPINLRIALIIAPDPLTEFVYPRGADIIESWLDNVPLADAYGPITDTTSVTIPGIGVLLANEPASRAASFLDLTTLRRRTWFPDLL